MKIFSITCTRNLKQGPLAQGLFDTLSSFGVSVKVVPEYISIFEAYKKGINNCDADPEDIIIFCHDDIQIVDSKIEFLAALSICVQKDIGIVGPAGTTLLGEDAVWWNQEKWKSGYHRGFVRHTSDVNGMHHVHDTTYGPQGQVVALDGLFLAARKEVWDEVCLDKPDYFEGNWDFYDIHYTTKAHILGYKNHTISMDIIHRSSGDLVGRDSWHKNRKSFIANTKLPLSC